jgi:hypothetical protein
MSGVAFLFFKSVKPYQQKLKAQELSHTYEEKIGSQE